MKTLVTGGTRSGKSAIAEAQLDADAAAVYIACGPSSDDHDWNERIRIHKERRPATWSTLETTDLVGALAGLQSPALVDCLGTWLTAQLDDLGAWELPIDVFADDLRARLDALASAVATCEQPLVIVTNEVGQSLISMDRSGRLFTDWLGWTNQAVAAACDRVLLVVAGCPVVVKG